MEKVTIVILAAGHGKRMQSDIPKVLSLLHGKPLIQHLVEHVKESGVCDSPVIVVGQSREQVMKELGDGYRYVVQEEQLGTGHAVLSTEKLLENVTEHVLVLNGDMPYTSPETIQRLAAYHIEQGNDMTIGTVLLPDFNDWRECFRSFGRIVRNKDGEVERIVYGKNLTEKELSITEVDPAYSCFKADWLWPHLKKLKNENDHKEYYITDMLALACGERAKLGTVAIDPKEALGVNTRENLELLHTFTV